MATQISFFMKYKNTELTLLFLMLIGSARLWAHEYPGCKNSDDNSCWNMENATVYSASIICNNKAPGKAFVAKNLQAGKSFTYQYCPALADGLGFAGGETSCKLTRSDGQK